MSDRGIEEALMDYQEYRIQRQLLLYVPPILLLVGTVGNVLSFCVLMRKTMIGTSTYNYLASIAVLDTLVLCADCLINWLGNATAADKIADQSIWGCKLIHFVVYTVSVSSAWLLIAVTVDRYIATVHGIHAMTMCTQRRAVKVITCIVACVTILHLHFTWTMGLRESEKGYTCRSAVKYEYLVDHIWPWIDGLMYCFAPFTIIATLNTLIIVQVAKSRRNRHRVSEYRCNGASSPSRSISTNSYHVTFMLLVVSFTFLVCTLPTAVFAIYRDVFVAHYGGNLQQLANMVLFRTVSKLLLYVNHSINFYLYLLSGQRFRQEMCAMIHDCCGHRTYRQAHEMYNTAAYRRTKAMTGAVVAIRRNNIDTDSTAL